MGYRSSSVKFGKEVGGIGISSMRHLIEIVSAEPTKDSMGFVSQTQHALAKVRASKESLRKNSSSGNEKTRNDATFSTSASLFRFRRIPNLEITTTMFILCDGDRYNISAVENVRGMYVEVVADKAEPSLR